MSFNKWKARLAGEKVLTFTSPDLDDEGYYRRPLVEPKLGADGKTNGQKRIIGWVPVAYFIDRGKLCGVIGDRDMAINEVSDEGLWSWVVSNPISEELFRAVSERGDPWPDLEVIRTSDVRLPEGTLMGAIDIPATNRNVAKTDNNPPEVLPDVAHAEAIDNAIAAAIKKVATEEEAAQALGSKNRIAELRLEADKAGKTLYQPPFNEYKRLYKLWTPMVERAEQAEKNLNTSILTFRESERKRLAKIAEEAAAKQREQDEANERAAQRAIARGEPEATPDITEAPPAAVPAPAPVVPTYGKRKLKEEEKWFLDEVTDYDALYAHFKNNEALKITLKTLATAAVKLGQTVPGTKTHRGLV